MTGAGRALLGLLAGLALAACAATPPPPATQKASGRSPAVAFGDDPRPLPRYHSRRLGLSVPLPDGPTWRIDDHTRPELIATHAPTQSRVMALVAHADELVGRAQCEAIARARKLVPAGPMQTLEDAVDVTLENYDTRIVVAVEPGAGPGSPIVGHVMAFGGFLRKCVLFDFSTRVDGASDEAILSSRLAFARARILGGLKLDVLGQVAREAPVMSEAPLVPPPPAPARP